MIFYNESEVCYFNDHSLYFNFPIEVNQKVLPKVTGICFGSNLELALKDDHFFSWMRASSSGGLSGAFSYYLEHLKDVETYSLATFLERDVTTDSNTFNCITNFKQQLMGLLDSQTQAKLITIWR